MGIFGRQDELFEIMAKQTNRRTPSKPSPAAAASAQTPRPRPVISGRLPRLSRPQDEELIEIEGDALVVIDDEVWEATQAEAGAKPDGAEGPGQLTLRMDTALVGAVLLAGVVAVAFLLGRTSSAPEPQAPVVEVAVTDEQPAQPSPAANQAAPAPTAITLPASAPRSAATTVGGGAPRTEPRPTPQPSQPLEGVYELIVVATTEEKAQAVAEWLNTNARSPIFGRTNLQAYARKGTVRIRGFSEREDDVRKRVRATADPTNGGSGTFNDAYYVKSR